MARRRRELSLGLAVLLTLAGAAAWGRFFPDWEPPSFDALPFLTGWRVPAVAFGLAVVVGGVFVVVAWWRRVPFQERIFRTRPRGPEWGYVYILKNPTMPGIYKVGFTADHPERRARALHTTGVAARFEVLWSLKADHARRIEQQAHRLLARYAVAANREFFRADPAQLVAVITTAKRHVEKMAAE